MPSTAVGFGDAGCGHIGHVSHLTVQPSRAYVALNPAAPLTVSLGPRLLSWRTGQGEVGQMGFGEIVGPPRSVDGLMWSTVLVPLPGRDLSFPGLSRAAAHSSPQP